MPAQGLQGAHKLTGAVKSSFIWGDGISWLQSEELVYWGEGTSGFQFQVPVLSPQAPVRESATGVTSTTGFLTCDWAAHLLWEGPSYSE